MKKYQHLTIANANAKNFTADLITKVEDAYSLAKGNLTGKIVVTKTLSELEKAIETYQEENPDFVGILSGDGGVMHARTLIENIWKHRPRYAFFPGGTMNNIQRTVGATKMNSSTIKLAKYIAAKASSGELEHSTVSLPSLDINGRKGFNIGLGLVPKLLWMYYGKSAEQYVLLQQELQNAPENKYQDVYNQIMKQQAEDLIEERGFIGSCRTAVKVLLGLRKAHSFERYLFSKPIDGTIAIDDDEKSFPEPPLGLYLSCYKEINLGFSFLNPKLIPEAGSTPGEVQGLIPYGNPLRIVWELPKIVLGRPLSHAHYFHASTVEVPSEKIAQVDGELFLQDGFAIKYDGKVKVISPLAEP